MRLPFSLVATMLVAACGGNRGAQSRAAPHDSIVGIVRIVGADPLSQVVLDRWSESQVAVVGDLRDEIGTLPGAIVRATGPVADNDQPRPARAVRPVSYEILAVQGAHPYVGRLEERGGRLSLLGLPLEAAESMAPHAGRRVWVIGEIERGTLRVSAYGLIGSR